MLGFFASRNTLKAPSLFAVEGKQGDGGARGRWGRSGVTSLQDLLDLDVVGAEGAVVPEVVGVEQEGSSQRAEDLLPETALQQEEEER